MYKGVQKWQCNNCGKHQREFYRQNCYDKEAEHRIVLLNNEGMGIRSIGRILHIPKSSVQLLLLKASQQVKPPIYDESGQVYEVDELYAPVGVKLCFVIYAINRATRKVIDYVTGARTKDNIGKVINKLLSLAPKKIYTDKLPLFSYIIPAKLHRVCKYKTNRIERKNLTLRTHIKRLSRKTICYSKSITMLEACFSLYVWKENETGLPAQHQPNRTLSR
ncbi:IS1 family transposase [Paraflavitalea speifideaquila]|uniref:IS1 family transposase n=1 Tax=Paraflavitalea speifideaquila TaxID=3076558 RepID=UPI0028E83663|nr:IS1 family transposase [Paraflavitalea speifideiaquila]